MRALFLAALLLPACDLFVLKPTDDTAGGDDSAAADADTDTDADADADSDTDSDTDTDTDDSLCDASLSTDAPGGPDCVTDTLSCGDVVEATNEGGDSAFVGDNWESWFCTPNLDSHHYDAPERVYTIQIPADTTATFDFDTPCADLDLFVAYWADEDTCPTIETSIRECEAADGTGNGDSVSVWSDVGAQYLVFVDGRDGDEGNFRISVDCQ